MVGKHFSPPPPIFSSPLVMTVNGSASVPVPAVVGIATIGSAAFAMRLPPP